MNKVLILDCTGTDWTDRQLRNLPNVEVDAIYSQCSMLFRGLRKLHFSTSFPGKQVWYGEWKKHIQEYDAIIIFSSLFGIEIFHWIRSKGYRGRLIFYYRDPQSASYLKNYCKVKELRTTDRTVELWTFDLYDAEKCNLKYNPQFFFEIPVIKMPMKYDAVYIGSSHGRTDKIKQYYSWLVDSGLMVHFLIRDDEDTLEDELGICLLQRGLSYEDILNLDRQSKAIIEINQDGQSGLTMRAMEALFLKKKLITDNKVIKDMDIYNANNIFIIGYDDMAKVKEFMQMPYISIDSIIKERYCARNWLSRFFA